MKLEAEAADGAAAADDIFLARVLASSVQTPS